MLIAERRRRLLEQVHQRGYASFRELALALGISESTVRRDLRQMVDQGLLASIRGGVGPSTAAPGRGAWPDLDPDGAAGTQGDGLAAGDPVHRERQAIAEHPRRWSSRAAPSCWARAARPPLSPANSPASPR